MFSTPSRVRSPVLGGVTASSAGGRFGSLSVSHLIGFSFMGLLPFSIGVIAWSLGRSGGALRAAIR